MIGRKNILIVFGIVFVLLTWLFVGLFRDDEFYELTLFTKYKPTFKVIFFSPIGMQDLSLNDLSAKNQLDEIAFDEFIIKQQLQNNSNGKLWFLPYILIQITLTLFAFGIYKTKYGITFNVWQILTHFFINLLITSTGIEFVLFFDRVYIAVILLLFIVIINYLTVSFLKKTNRKTRID